MSSRGSSGSSQHCVWRLAIQQTCRASFGPSAKGRYFWWFPNIRSTIMGSPDCSIIGSIWGSPLFQEIPFGNTQVWVQGCRVVGSWEVRADGT